MNIKWDAEKYTEVFSFVHKYGNDVLELLELEPGMSVLDLGCGNGALTKRLSDAGAGALGLDASAELLAIARQNYPDLRFIQADATDFALPEPVDAVFSNAVFHWIDLEKQPELLQCVHRALRPGGQFVFEFGGYGNNRLIHEALQKGFERRGLKYKMPFYFPTIGEYSLLLEAAGFRVTFMTLFDRPTLLKGPDGLADWIRMFVRTPFEGMDVGQEKAIIDEAVGLLRSELCRDGTWYADYVRLRGKAIKPR